MNVAEPKEAIVVLIGGDLCPVGTNESLFRRGEVEAVFRDLLGELRAADLTLVNLECPLIGRPSPVRTTGPALGAHTDCADGLRRAGIDVVGLANNHIMDHGPGGLRSTLEACAAADLQTVGAGADLAHARRILVRQANGIRIGILAMAEREFSIAARASGGANPLDPIDFVRNVRQNRKAFDYLLVLLHSGNEFHPFPSPRLRDTCRFLIEEGTDAVICQHSHCPGSYETYREGHIVYGQGNLIFEPLGRRDDSWHEGFLVKLEINPRCESTMSLVPYRKSETGPGIARLSPDEERDFRDRIDRRSKVVLDDRRLEAEWRGFCESRRHDYLSNLLGFGKILRFLNRRLQLVDRLYSPSSFRLMQNSIRCDLHRDVLLTLLAKERRAGPDRRPPSDRASERSPRPDPLEPTRDRRTAEPAD